VVRTVLRALLFFAAMSAHASGISVKFADLIRQYDGTGDFLEWLEKLELVAALQNVADLEKFLPLFLSSGAFAVYKSLTDVAKKDYRAVKAALTKAFSASPLKAYEQLVSRRLAIGESVDVYLADLTRLAKLVAKVDEDWLKCAFVFGLPEEMKSQMHVACSLMAMSLAEVVEKARSLEASREACCVVAAKETSHRVERGGGRVSGRGNRACYNCGEDGHVSRLCPNRKGGGAGEVRFCYVCGASGHMAAACSLRKTAPSSAKNE